MKDEGSNGEFVDAVRGVRARLGLTQEGLARTLGVTFATINGWENGRHRPSPALAERLEALASTDARAADTGRPAVLQADDAPRGGPVPAAAARTGWELDGRERRDFYHRIREFPPSVADWRGRLVKSVMEDEERFTAKALLTARAAGDQEAVRALVDDVISYLREVARLVAILHGTPRLGNKRDPVDELVYIILSRKTREDAYQSTYSALRARFPAWEDILAADRAEIEALLRPGGLPEKKAESIIGALRALHERFGRCTLEPTRAWTDEELETFLCSLPEISRKSAYCVMMYALDRAVFPVDTHVGRVLARLGPYTQLGLDLEGLDHKKLQAELADLVPPPIRYSLHVNLVAHGRDVCRAGRPLCDQCELRPLCRHHRQEQRQRIESVTDAPTTIDLFCGAGGVTEGFKTKGFRCELSLDADPVALRTFRLNHPGVPDERILCGDIREIGPAGIRKLLGKRRIDVVIGAPPCQGFSHVGHRAKGSRTGYTPTVDERNYLYEPMIDVVRALRPRLVLMENVPGMKSAQRDGRSFMDDAAARLEAAGYRTAQWRLAASAHGVPQDRVRMFLVAARGAPLPRVPAATYQDPLSRSIDADALPPVTFDDATFDLPPRAADEGWPVDLRPRTVDEGDARYRRYLEKFGLRTRSRLLYGHWVRYHNERDLELYALLRPGEDSVHALERHNRADLMRYRADVFDDKYARLRADRPSKTIVAHLAKDGNGYIHPTQPRSISFREAARLQSFPDDYIFCGSPTDQWVHLGNAVPPLLARAIATSFLEALAQPESR
jgi:DNA (cytosine-5)-methyltransferase 1